MLPMLNNTRTYSRSVISLKSINYTENTDAGSVRDSNGITADKYPYICTVNASEQIDSGIDDATEWNGLITCKDGKVYYDGDVVASVSSGKKQFAVVNTKLCIFPDKIFVDLENKQSGRLDADVSAETGSASVAGGNTLNVKLTGKTGTALSYFYSINAATAPMRQTEWVNVYSSVSYVDGQLVKTGKTTKPAKRLAYGDIVVPKKTQVGYEVISDYGPYVNSVDDYSSLSAPYIPDSDEATDGTYYVFTENNVTTRLWLQKFEEIALDFDVYKVSTNAKLTDAFTAGDAVTVLKDGEVIVDKQIALEVADGHIKFADGTFTADRDLTGSIEIKREVPDLDFICESENRLWGCAGHTIYASALGDPKNFYFYDTGESTASYAVAVGTEGKFTGCAKYGSAVLFFKEKCIHKVLGSYPAEYSVYTSYAEGVKDGSERSIAMLNGALLYHGLHGIYSYTGSLPSLISGNFGTKEFSEGVGGSDGRKYYFSAKEGETSHFFTYDTSSGIWCREHDFYVGRFILLGSRICWISDDALYRETAESADSEWYIEFAPFTDIRNDTTFYIHRARYEKLILHIDMPRSSYMVAEVASDGGKMSEVGRFTGGDSVRQILLPVNRSESFTLRLSGKGRCVIKSITRKFEQRSEKE